MALEPRGCPDENAREVRAVLHKAVGLIMSLALALAAGCGGDEGAESSGDAGTGVPIIGGGTSEQCLAAPPNLSVRPSDGPRFVMPQAVLGQAAVKMPLTINFTQGLTGPLRTSVIGNNPWRAGFSTAQDGCDGRFGCLVYAKTPNCSLDLVFAPSPDMIPAGGGKGPFSRPATVCFEEQQITCIMLTASFVVP